MGTSIECCCCCLQKTKNAWKKLYIKSPRQRNLFLWNNNRNHRKITIIDGKDGFTGGYNLANEYFNYINPYG